MSYFVGLGTGSSAARYRLAQYKYGVVLVYLGVEVDSKAMQIEMLLFLACGEFQLEITKISQRFKRLQ